MTGDNDSNSHGNSGGVRILIVDDDALVRGTLVENLRESGFQVMAARDGIDALEQIGAGPPPAIVITDIIMPRKEGLETILDLRRQYPAIRVIAMSGGGRNSGGDFLDMAEKLGADATLSKPLDFEALERKVRALAAG